MIDRLIVAQEKDIFLILKMLSNFFHNKQVIVVGIILRKSEKLQILRYWK